ncbi:MAG: transcriptional regulator [Spirosomataceae bacterium]
MKSIIQHLNKAFDNRVRLGIMSLLMIHDWVDFGELKEALELTDGNLASHLLALEKAEYLQIRKGFIGRKPNTSYAATQAGRAAFQAHLDALESLIKNRNPEE